MKKIITILLCLVMILATVGCSADDKNAGNYDELVHELEVAVNAMFAKDFETNVEEGEYPSPTGDNEDKWKAMLLDAAKDFPGVDENAFGYKLIDINSDSVPELIFCRTDDMPLAVFTIHDGKVTLVDAYSRTYRCVIRDTGELYTMTVRTDGGYEYDIATLNPSSGTLYTTVSFGTEEDICYEAIDGVTYTTSGDRITELKDEYPHEHGEAFPASEFYLF